jgi:hypothetical protein
MAPKDSAAFQQMIQAGSRSRDLMNECFKDERMMELIPNIIERRKTCESKYSLQGDYTKSCVVFSMKQTKDKYPSNVIMWRDYLNTQTSCSNRERPAILPHGIISYHDLTPEEKQKFPALEYAEIVQQFGPFPREQAK